ncbi:MAG: ASKHA domain-containing protein [Kiritimatiellae bacterium]|nr:ASKHA domain-containing protein [Kiritimatiellia bacterium]
MKRQEYKIIFEPTGRQVFVLPGTILLEAAAQAGLIIQTPCGGAGRCGKCRLKVISGACPPSANCRTALSEPDLAQGYRLACHAKIQGNLVVEVPATSLFESQQQILVQATGEPMELSPAISKRFVELELPSQADSRSDVERLRTVIPPLVFNPVGIRMLRLLPGIFRRQGFRGTAVIVDGELVDVEPGNTTSLCYGVAVDIGTTTLVGTLVNLKTGLDMGVEAKINPQTSYGDDVISRIRKCREEANGLAQLQRMIIGAVNDIVDALVRAAGIDRVHIYEIVMAGNTTMQQIVCGIDPSALGELPFVPVFTDAPDLESSDLGLDINPCGKVYVFPQIGGFVGGDTVAGIVASHLDRGTETVLFVDIGTNGEIVLAHKGQMMATSVAAGPAFEGARISCGMRATNGAIEKVVMDGDLRMNVIGNTRPAGLCGSGLVDTVAELLRTGLLDPTGRLRTPDEIPSDAPPALRKRLIEKDGHVDFMLAGKTETGSGKSLLLTQRDVRELQLASAAIRAGISILLEMAGLQPMDLSRILLAGGFGNFIRRNHARRIGLLPPIPCERIRFIGNASSMGAKRALLSVAEKQSASVIARSVRHVDLSLSPEFQTEFSAAMLFPEDDPGKDCEG